MKKKFGIVVLAMVMAGLMAGTCFAVPAWYYVDVLGTGANLATGASVQIKDQGGTFPATWFAFDPTVAKSALAVALTCLSNGTRGYCVVDPTNPAFQIKIFYNAPQ